MICMDQIDTSRVMIICCSLTICGMFIQVNAWVLYNPGAEKSPTECIWNSFLIRDSKAIKKSQNLPKIQGLIAIRDTYKQLRSEIDWGMNFNTSCCVFIFNQLHPKFWEALIFFIADEKRNLEVPSVPPVSAYLPCHRTQRWTFDENSKTLP